MIYIYDETVNNCYIDTSDFELSRIRNFELPWVVRFCTKVLFCVLVHI